MRCTQRDHASWAFGIFRTSVHHGGFEVSTTEVAFPTPDEIEGFWNLDRMHAPRPITPLSFDLIIETLAWGFTKAQAEYDCPIMVTPKEINHYVYVSFHPVDDDAVIADRMGRYEATLAAKVPKVGKLWDEEWKPVVLDEQPGQERADYSGLSDAEMVAKLDEFIDQCATSGGSTGTSTSSSCRAARSATCTTR